MEHGVRSFTNKDSFEIDWDFRPCARGLIRPNNSRAAPRRCARHALGKRQRLQDRNRIARLENKSPGFVHFANDIHDSSLRDFYDVAGINEDVVPRIP